ncbi:MAG: RNA methyltransferase [Candidatus Vogelbacteria bacterium CG10_big_fil_rev_8_21_14_0_10_45_14]|uniref:RNA methyltransferase n=1 Tax=Candidatus Vogelbacteria bacterium CG10_big_fil_rev_8_21_14_0_10_45_14 TaxID=1975042 RepID=A0A2H0RLR4_9BACT|nr:MAG: RNA methyltransferase [Candidatus Vogelbacteria bacterium CG10_big_fil_rev_8_21_14_0_10_45_14]
MTEERKNKIGAMEKQRQSGFLVVLENVHDPHNAEAVLRSCDAFGVGEVWFVNEAVPNFNPKKVGKKTSGSANKWLTFKNWSRIDDAMEELENLGYTTIATLLSTNSESVYQAKFPEEKIALIFGNEHSGLSERAISGSRRKITIPMRGMVQSLNISVSASIFIYEISRQRLLEKHL